MEQTITHIGTRIAQRLGALVAGLFAPAPAPVLIAIRSDGRRVQVTMAAVRSRARAR
jgi:hypothetical protein